MTGRILVLLVGVYACSTAAIMIRLSGENDILLSAYRLIVAALLLTPAFVRDRARARAEGEAVDLKKSILPGVVLGLHFISWIIGVRMTEVVNASLIVNLVPIAMPFFLFFMMAEKLNCGELAGTVVSLSGLGLLIWADYHFKAENFAGDLLCFGSMLLFAFYLALGRRNRTAKSIWVYVVPLYYSAAAACFVCFGVWYVFSEFVLVRPVEFIRAYTLREFLPVLGLGVVPTIVGHSILNHSMKVMRGQTVSIVNLGQFVFAGVMAYYIFDEAPDRFFYLSCALLVAGAVTAIRSYPAADRPK